MLNSSHGPRVRTFVRLAGLALVLCQAVPALAQINQIKGLRDLEDEYERKKPVRDLVARLIKGEVAVDPTAKDQMDALDIYAAYLTHRFASPEYHKPSSPEAIKTVGRLYQEVDREITSIVAGKEKLKELGRVFGRKLQEQALVVLKNEPKSIVQVNVARVLARLAVLGQPELADALVEVFKDPRSNDAVKYYALRGLRDLLAQPINPPVLTPQRAQQVLPPVVEFVTRKVNFTPVTPKDEIDGYRTLRREAIRVLAASRVAKVSDKDRPALALLQVMNKEDVIPQPRIDERMEAAIGLARMLPDKEKDYQVDYALSQIAPFLGEYVTYIQTNDEARPWRTMAARFLDALDALKNDTKDPAVLKLVSDRAGFKALLEKIEKDPKTANASDLLDLVRNSPPTSNQLFKNLPPPAPAPKDKE